MGWWKAIFSAPKIVDTGCEVVKTGVGMLDSAWYTKQEQAANALAVGQLALERVKVALDESTVRSITRRFLAFAIVGEAMFLTNFAALFFIIGKAAWARFMLELMKYWSVALASVVIFYFGYYGIQQIIKTKNGG